MIPYLRKGYKHTGKSEGKKGNLAYSHMNAIKVPMENYIHVF